MNIFVDGYTPSGNGTAEVSGAGVAAVPFDVLGRLMPLSLIVSPTGHILRTGPTMARLLGPDRARGARLLDLFEFRRPGNLHSMEDLRAAAALALKIRLRQPPRTALKGHVAVLPGRDGFLLNLSFGIGVADAVARHGLTATDFPPTDLAVEMMYLMEAKQALMEESAQLNLRLRAARTEAEQQALTDTLTGLQNRRAMNRILAQYTLGGVGFGLMQVDLDHFKAVNDTLGHAAGDHVLRETARILTRETRRSDTVVRAGGDEFVLIFHRLTEPAKLRGIADRLLARLEAPMSYEGKDCSISASIGITVTDCYAAPNPDQMLLDADAALYESKAAGRSCHRFSTAMDFSGRGG